MSDECTLNTLNLDTINVENGSLSLLVIRGKHIQKASLGSGLINKLKVKVRRKICTL